MLGKLTRTSLSKGQIGSASVASIKTLNFEEWRSIMLYVLTNLSEVQPYIQKVLCIHLVLEYSLFGIQPVRFSFEQEISCAILASIKDTYPLGS